MLSAKIRRGFHKLRRHGAHNSPDSSDALTELLRVGRIDLTGFQVLDEFEYEALAPRNMFRFLTLLPGSGDDEINCELSIHRVDSHAGTETPDDTFSYEALSYTWGSVTDMLSIKIGGKKKFVTKTLHSALLHLRDAAASRVLWVDAVCINQRDNQERSDQVMQMGLLYRRAKRVLAWIGEMEVGFDFGFTLANALPKALRGELDEEDADLASIVRWVFGLEGRIPLDSNPRFKQFVVMAWKVLDEILARPWFRRVWIVQEVVLGGEVTIQCGKRWVDFEIFYLAIIKSSMFRESSKLIELGGDHAWTSLMGIGRLRGELQGRMDNFPNLLQLLSRFTYSEATDDRDRIFSFLGITHPSIEASKQLSYGFVPDYTKTIPQVYKDFALYWMQTHKNLDLFSRIKDRDGKHQGKYHSQLPSWVPDWTHIDGLSSAFIDIQAPEKNPYRASGDEPAKVSYEPEVDILFVNGFTFDTIVRVPDEPQWKDMADPQSKNWKEWHGIALNHSVSENPYVTAAGREEAYWRTLVAGVDSSGQPAPAEFGMQFYKWTGLQPSTTTSSTTPLTPSQSSVDSPSTSGPSSTSPPDSDAVQNTALNDIIDAGTAIGLCSKVETPFAKWRSEEDGSFKQQVFKTVHIRRIFVTQRGYIGIGPDQVREGDQIAVLYGGKMPCVLRAKDGVLFEKLGKGGKEGEEGSGGGGGGAGGTGSAADEEEAFVVQTFELIDGGECYVHGVMGGEAMSIVGSEVREGSQVLLA